MRLLLATAVAATLLLAAPAGAGAATFKGKTNQKRDVTVRTGADGLVTLVRLPWRAGCDRPRARFTERTDFGRPLKQSTLDVVADDGAYTLRRRGGWRFRVTVAMAGRRSLTDPADPSTEQWAGTLSASVVVRRKGRVFDRCKLAPTTWTARKVPPPSVS